MQDIKNIKMNLTKSSRPAYNDSIDIPLSPAELSHIIFALEKIKNIKSGCAGCDKKMIIDGKLYKYLNDILAEWRRRI